MPVPSVEIRENLFNDSPMTDLPRDEPGMPVDPPNRHENVTYHPLINGTFAFFVFYKFFENKQF